MRSRRQVCSQQFSQGIRKLSGRQIVREKRKTFFHMTWEVPGRVLQLVLYMEDWRPHVTSRDGHCAAVPQVALSTQANTYRENTQKLMVAQRKNEVGYLTYFKLWESSCRTVPAVLKLPHTAGQQWHCWQQGTTQSSGWDCLLKKSE